MGTGRRRIVAAAVIAAAALAAAGCGAGSGPSATTAAPATPVTAPVPASARPELRRYQAAVRRIVAALNGWGAALRSPEDGAGLRGALDRVQAALDRVEQMPLASEAVAARRQSLVAAGDGMMAQLRDYTDDVARGHLADAARRGDRITAALRNFAVAAGS